MNQILRNFDTLAVSAASATSLHADAMVHASPAGYLGCCNAFELKHAKASLPVKRYNLTAGSKA